MNSSNAAFPKKPINHMDTGWTEGYGASLVKNLFEVSDSISDLGCGNGWLEKQLPEYNISAIDYPQYDFNVGKLPYEDNSLDGAIAFQVLEHLENPYHFVREVHRVLKSGGKFICSTPNVFHLYNRISFLKNGNHYRFTKTNDHVFAGSEDIFHKMFLKFSTSEHFFRRGIFPYPFLNRFSYPQTELFGQDICWILRK